MNHRSPFSTYSIRSTGSIHKYIYYIVLITTFVTQTDHSSIIFISLATRRLLFVVATLESHTQSDRRISIFLSLRLGRTTW